jgi:hypothetical protein
MNCSIDKQGFIVKIQKLQFFSYDCSKERCQMLPLLLTQDQDERVTIAV